MRVRLCLLHQSTAGITEPGRGRLCKKRLRRGADWQYTEAGAAAGAAAGLCSQRRHQRCALCSSYRCKEDSPEAAYNRLLWQAGSSGYTPLHYAARAGHCAAVQMLLDAGASAAVGVCLFKSTARLTELLCARRGPQPRHHSRRSNQPAPRGVHGARCCRAHPVRPNSCCSAGSHCLTPA